MSRPGEDGNREEWLVRQFAQTPRRDVFFNIEAGQMEVATNLLASNRHPRDVLVAKAMAFIISKCLAPTNRSIGDGRFRSPWR